MDKFGTDMGAASAKFCIGIIGAGAISTNSHIPTLQAISDVRIAWITDRDSKKAERVARASRIPFVALPVALEGLPPADVVLLAIPYGARSPYYEVLKRRNAAVYVEKPFARTPEAHTALCSFFPPFMIACGLQRRASAAAKVVSEVLKDGIFGDLQAIRLGYGNRGRVSSGGYLSDPNLAGGGPLLELAIHGIDLALLISRAVGLDRVQGKMLTSGPFDMHTKAVIDLRVSDNRKVPFQVEISSLVNTSNSLDFVCERATVSIGLSSNVVMVAPVLGKSQYVISDAAGGQCTTSHQESYDTWRHFLAGIRTRIPNWTAASSSLLTTIVASGLYRLGYPQWPDTDIQDSLPTEKEVIC